MSERPDFERFRPALLLWAQCQLPAWLRGKLDPEDLVNTVLLAAHAAREKLAGLSDDGARAYLRRALCNDLIDAARKHARSRSDVSPDDIAQSSVRLADWIEAKHTSPSEKAVRNEQFERLAAALAELPDAQRIAIEMRHLQGRKIAEIARLLNRTENAVSQLLHRAERALGAALTGPAT